MTATSGGTTWRLRKDWIPAALSAIALLAVATFSRRAEWSEPPRVSAVTRGVSKLRVPVGAKVVGFVDYVAAVPDKEALGKLNLTARGWSASCVPGTTIVSVAAVIDGKAVAETKQFSERPDVSAAYDQAEFLRSGWNLWFSLEKDSIRGHALSFRAVNSKGDSQELPSVKFDLTSSADR